MTKKVLFIASNLGLWGEELQAPWDAIRKAGFEATLATEQGKTPLPLKLSMIPDFIDPVQNAQVNTPEVVDRIREILASGEWDNPIKIEDAKMADFDALVMVGGPGSPFDITGNHKVHQLVLEAYKSNKIIGALCYVVGALAMTRDPENNNKSVIYGHNVVAHPREWDYFGSLNYPLDGATPDNPGTDIVTPGFIYQLQPIVEDAVGSNGSVTAVPSANRDNPVAMYDHPFVTAQSVESSIAYGAKLVEVLSK